MNICHLYYKKTRSEQAKKIMSSFDNSLSMDINEIDKVEDFSIYFIELNKIDKEISVKIKTLFSNKSFPLIYFIVSSEYNLMLFQLAFLLKAKTVITKNQDSSKIIAKIKNDFKVYEDENIQNMLGKNMINTQLFMLFSHNKLFFASKKILEEFGCRNLAEVEQKICSKFDLKEPILSPSQENLFFHIRSSNLNKKNEKLISLEPYYKDSIKEKKIDFLSSRVSFVDLLNQKIIQKKSVDNNVSIITLQIENLNKLSLDVNRIIVENFIKEFLIKIETILVDKRIFAQYSPDLYVSIFENIELEDLKEKANYFLSEISTFLNEQKFTPFINLAVFNIDELDLNNVLNVIDDISTKTRVINSNIFYIGNLNNKMDESDNIQYLLESAYSNKMDIKLLNIYKGLVINTTSKIIKISDNSIYIRFESLQGIVMMNEKETVLQSSSFLKDIKGVVKYVNMDKKVAILEKFSFLDGTANSRKNNRVTSATRTPIRVANSLGSLSGEIIDISAKSIAVRAKYAKILDTIKSSKVKLSFVLPLRSSEDGLEKLDIDATVLFAKCNSGLCTVICELVENDAVDSIIMEYIYERQKEIILEIKNITKRV